MKVRFRTSSARQTCVCGCGGPIERGDRTVWLAAYGPLQFACALEHLRRERRRQHSSASWAIRKVKSAMSIGPLIVGWKGDQPVLTGAPGAGPGRPISMPEGPG